MTALSIDGMADRLTRLEAVIAGLDPVLPLLAGREPVLAAIMADVSKSLGIAASTIASHSRHAEAVRARAALVWTARALTGFSYPQLGRFLRRDHTTVIMSYRYADVLRGRDVTFAALTDLLLLRARERSV